MNPVILWCVAGGLLAIALLQIWMAADLMQIWLKAFMAGAPVSFMILVAMKLRGSPLTLLIDTFISLKHRGVSASIADVERTYLAMQHPHVTVTELADTVERRLNKS